MFPRIRFSYVVALILVFSSVSFSQEAPELRGIDSIIESSIQANQIPGAVVLIGHDGKIVYKKAYGNKSLEPVRQKMTEDTIFDMASLTKCLATATAVMQLEEQGKIRLNDTVAKYIPEFGKNGKEQITIRQLVTHFSGLREDLDLKPAWQGKQTAYQMANDEIPVAPAGSEFRYSDINYIMLGELVERVSGMSLDEYAAKNIFKPLAMEHTRYLPPSEWRERIAPTEYDEYDPAHKMLHGVVHDPTSRFMGGVAGHAGVFSTASDVSKFAQAMLDAKFVISAASIQKMTTPQQPPNSVEMRGVGWDLDTPFSSNRGEMLPIGSFGHTGFTGTSLWIDPTTNSYIILLTNAVHPKLRPGSPAVALRTKVATFVAANLKLSPSETERFRLKSITGYNEAMSGARRLTSRNGLVTLGVDQLQEQWTRLTEGTDSPHLGCRNNPCRVGVVTNQTGLDSNGQRTVDVLARNQQLKLVAIFSPEHGMTGALETTAIGNSVDATTQIPVYSVYGDSTEKRHPPLDVLRTLDAVIYDIQDVGVRYYTYESTLGYFLESCGKTGVPLIVLDRPNPVTGSFVQGPVADAGRSAFVAYWQTPLRHGMTVGELAKMFNDEQKLNATLIVVTMKGWQRGDWLDSTGMTWTSPSPNMRSLTEATLYTGVGVIEGTNISVGRGTDTPFEVLGAPWIDERQFAAYLNGRKLAGVRFVPTRFTPTSSNYANQVCHGVNIFVTDRNQLDGPELGMELASALIKLYPQQYKLDRLDWLMVHAATFEALKRGDDPRAISDSWRDRLQEFMKVRAKYLLY
jgi:uncharacterized protein YbbC (DUF1343 family)/CubicO group peptidase (beta-lactamase class C family)